MKVAYSKSSTKTLNRIPANTRLLIIAKVKQYAADPESLAANVKKLQTTKGEVPLWRLRVGGWRVIFTKTEDEIGVRRIAPRGGAYD